MNTTDILVSLTGLIATSVFVLFMRASKMSGGGGVVSVLKMRTLHTMAVTFLIEGGLLVALDRPVLTVATALGASLIISLVVSVWLVFCLYVWAESSIHVRILEIIAQSESRGITKGELFKKYNDRYIYEKRIARLMGDGVLTKTKHGYMITGNEMFLTVRDWVFAVLAKILGVPP